MFFSASKKHPLSTLSSQYRLDLLEMIYRSGSGHFGGPLSSMDILISLYKSQIFNPPRDHFVLSAGHLAPALYVVLANSGFFDKKLLSKFASFNSPLQSHVSTDVPGVEYSSGSLGQGLSFAAGLALGDKSHSAICLTTDGEHNEGQIWEAVAFANKYHLGNLINIVDQNGFQIDGPTSEIMPLDYIAAKYLRFGWTVTTVDGHNFNQIEKALKKARDTTIYPSCIIANTTLGKGISFAQNNYLYHDVKNLPENLYLKAKKELEAK